MPQVYKKKVFASLSKILKSGSEMNPKLKVTPWLILILFGALARFYGLNFHWGTKDHVNYGGAYMTAATRCMKTTPLSVSKAIPHIGCENSNPSYYRNHPPTILLGLWAWTDLLGDHESSYRSFTLIFSLLNILMIFLIGLAVWPHDSRPFIAAAFWSLFLGPIYFGTHIDFITETTVFFVLASAFCALVDHFLLAGVLTLIAGLTAWPGYLMLGPLYIVAFIRRRHFLSLAFMTCLCVAAALATMAYLNQTWDLIDFLKARLVSPQYIKTEQRDSLLPLRFVKNFLQSMARLLSPLFCLFAFYELFQGEASLFFRRRSRLPLTKYHEALILTGGTGLIYAVIGYQYVMVHIFLYLFLIPAMALMCGQYFYSVLTSEYAVPTKTMAFAIALPFLALYPYGIFKGSPILDGFNSGLFILLTLLFLGLKKYLQPRYLLLIVAANGFTNFLQVVNYRSDDDHEYAFCEKARDEYARTHAPVKTTERYTMTKDLVYCHGIPIEYMSPEASSTPLPNSTPAQPSPKAEP